MKKRKVFGLTWDNNFLCKKVNKWLCYNGNMLVVVRIKQKLRHGLKFEIEEQ